MLLGILVTSPKVKKFMNYRKSQNLPGLPPVYDIWQKENHYLVPSTPETDYPCYIPPNVTGCGPILLPTLPVSKDDPSLQSWLERAPTVLINLGTHIRMSDAMAREFAAGLKIVLDRKPDLQILWKLKTSGGLAMPSKVKSGSGFQGEGIQKESLAAISAEVSCDRVRIVEWMSVSPLAVLQTGRIVCSVHHGGANSFHEALSAGVPHVVLPCWLDTLEFANRVEWLGIGVYGSRSATPSVEGHELSHALMKVLGGGIEAAQMKRKARELAHVSGKVGGRKKASRKILEILEGA
ncbi:MAG: hypothetical protein M1818_002448 [Claussenomyces sp. TS43310]|nr:MAG: hypothetical protein M1818_002448 [Claussenomyces sp. TS43310]